MCWLTTNDHLQLCDLQFKKDLLCAEYLVLTFIKNAIIDEKLVSGPCIA